MTIITTASTADISTIQTLAHSIWPNAYGDIISHAQIDYMLQLIYSETALLQQMKNGHQFLLAYHNERPVGYASFSVKSTETPQLFRLHKLYVDTTLHTRGIGKALLLQVVNHCKQQGATSLELNVNKYNKALHFYNKMGFTISKEEVIDIGNGYVMDDYVMTLPIVH